MRSSKLENGCVNFSDNTLRRLQNLFELFSQGDLQDAIANMKAIKKTFEAEGMACLASS
jgi:hypothetical protein